MISESTPKKKKITIKHVLLIVCIIAVVTQIITAIIDIVGGASISSVLTENILVWVGSLLPLFVVLFIFDNEQKSKEKKDAQAQE